MTSSIIIHLLDRSETESEWVRDVFIHSHIVTSEAQAYLPRFLAPKNALSPGPKLLCHALGEFHLPGMPTNSKQSRHFWVIA